MNENEKDILAKALQRTKESVQYQAGMAIVAIATTVVLCFALTVAWYSNILHTTDLSFKAESWDFVFTGNVYVGSENNIMAAPGDIGFVPLSLANISDERVLGGDNGVSAIGMTVNMDKSMMKSLSERIYFYVDHPITSNDESTDRQYLSTVDSYQYTIYPGHTLTLSEEYSNDYPIQWEWVYDVVGYYVRGTLKDGTIENPEYIRPIVFDPMKAVYNDKGVVTTIDGMSTDEFIQKNYLEKDGYSGNQIKKVENGKYYKVAEDLYIYLCNKTEVDANTSLDATFAKGADLNDYTSKIILTGVKANASSMKVTSSSAFADAINAGYSILELDGDMELVNPIVVDSETDVMVNLNGHTLTVNTSINANEGSSIGFMNGTINTTQEKATFLEATASQIYIDNITLEGFYSGIEAYDTESVEDSHVYISRSTITTEDSIVWLKGNGAKSSRKTTLIIEDSTLTSTEFVAVGGNGTFAYNGTDMKIISSTLTGKYAGVYHPQTNSQLLIKDSTLTGYTGMVIKGGDVIVENSEIHGIGKAQTPAYAPNGFTDTGSGIYIEDNYAVDQDVSITLTINDNVVTGNKTNILSDYGHAIEVFDPNSEKVSVVVNGGIYSSDVEKYLPKDNSKEITKLADGRYEVE